MQNINIFEMLIIVCLLCTLNEHLVNFTPLGTE